MALEYWINSILSGPITQTVNFLSNVAVGIWMPLESLAGSALLGDTAGMREAVAHSGGFVNGIRATFRITTAGRKVAMGALGDITSGNFAKAGRTIAGAGDDLGSIYHAFSSGQPILDAASKIDLAPAISAANAGLQAGSVGAKLVDAFGTTIRMPSRLLTTADELAKTVNYHMRLNALAVRDATNKGLRGSGPEFDNAIRSMVDRAPRWDLLDPSDPDRYALRQLHDESLKYAQKATFTESLMPNSLGHSAQRFVNNHPTLRFVAPFIRTPTNILKFVGQRTPGLHKLSREYTMIMEGTDEAAKQAARSRWIVGGGAWVAAGYAAFEGKFTGGGPSNFEERQTLMLTGWQPYSFRFPQEDGTVKYVSFNRSDPFGMFLGLAADWADIVGEMDEMETQEFAVAAGIAVMNNLKSKSYFQGITQLVDAFNHPDQKVEGFINRMAGSFVPNLLKSTNRTGILGEGDDAIREVGSLLEALKRGTPWADGLATRRNIFGEVVTYPMGVGWDTISPFFQRTSNKDPAALAAVEIKYHPNMQRLFGSIGPTELTPQQKEEYIKLTSQDLTGHGRTLKQTLNKLVTSPEWEKLGDTTVDVKGGKHDVFHRVVELHRKRAQSIMMQRHPELREALISERLLKRRAKLKHTQQQAGDIQNPLLNLLNPGQ